MQNKKEWKAGQWIWSEIRKEALIITERYDESHPYSCSLASVLNYPTVYKRLATGNEWFESLDKLDAFKGNMKKLWYKIKDSFEEENDNFD